ncbi:MAG: phosphatidylserine decarboxylase family protein [Deltaproteobacteria bacterium]|nr:MAG: phosphatidylserine decarboxylase family protein [Deltaproteobacteria bacterium]
MRFTEFPVAKEGLILVIPLSILTIVLGFLLPVYITLLLVLIDLFLLYFFRNPERRIPDFKGSVVAPADGKVIHAGEYLEDRFLGGKTIKISIFMSIFNVHINRIPTSGRITDVFYKKGRFFSANFDKASLLNEHNAVLMETENGKKVLFVQIAGLVARRIICWIKKGDSVVRGQRFGLICFGSRVDIFLPLETKIDVKIGQRVKGGETILGYLT